MVAKVRSRSSDKPGLAFYSARGRGRALPNAPSKNTDTLERWDLGGDPRGLEGQIYESYIYCRRQKKKLEIVIDCTILVENDPCTNNTK